MRWSHGEVKGTLEGSPVAGRGAVQQVMAQFDRREVLIKQGLLPRPSARPLRHAGASRVTDRRMAGGPQTGLLE